jgi:hypothetical protein
VTFYDSYDQACYACALSGRDVNAGECAKVTSGCDRQQHYSLE